MPYPHTYITLTPDEREKVRRELQRLAFLHKWKKRKPLQTLWLSNEQKPFRDIANHLGVSYRTIQRWVSKYRKEGLNAFFNTNRNESNKSH